MIKLILASASLGRKKLLDELKIPYEIYPSMIDEEKILGSTPLETLQLRAKCKGENVFAKIKNQKCEKKKGKKSKFIGKESDLEGYLILSADSGAIIDNRLIGKPKDYNDAVRILKILSGRTHRFATAVQFIKVAIRENKFDKVAISQSYEISIVTFRRLSNADIKRYLSITKYTRYAAGYALGTGQDFIIKIEGSISNIIGLPLEKVIPTLRENKLIA